MNATGRSPDPAIDVIVAGGGLAGPAAAILLARAGRSVTLIEREREPRHKVCGEFLSAEALALLRDLGVSPAALGAVPIRGVRLCSARKTTEAELPFPAMSLTRGRLDEALLAIAETTGVRVLRGLTVDRLEQREGHWHAQLSDGRTLSAPDAVLATGKHDLRGYRRPPGPQRDLVGLKMYWRLAPPQAAALGNRVELLLYPGGYAGLQPVENGAANLCCLVERNALARLGGWDGLLRHMRAHCPALAQQLDGAIPLLDRPLAIAPIPYGYVRRHAPGERLWAVGDQAAVIPSFTGDGMSIALYSGRCAAQALLAGDPAQAFQQALHRRLRWQVARSTAVSRALLYAPTRRLLVFVVARCPALLRGTAIATRLPGIRLDALSQAH